ncbi:MAG: TonB-dependent receptor [Chitinophagaceae bacterium]|nr:MAG: TonB-dependent receptor [Chitinophagaceae bacterium]
MFIFTRMHPIKPALIFILLIVCITSSAQQGNPGIIAGNLMDEKSKAVSGATIELNLVSDSSNARLTTASASNGDFVFTALPFGYYRLRVSYVGFKSIIIDSIHVRDERFDFSLNDLVLKLDVTAELDEVVVYAEKPLIQSKDGNITFNAGESPLSAGSNASELLKNVPLIATDPDGKLSVRGREPKILIDDKPVELNAQQLQDFLESLPGSMIERIEVMTNPPPQYANEQGGVINIVTRKGRVGLGGRLSASAGTRGETGVSGNLNYRQKGLSINLNAGAGFNRYTGYGYSKRENIYPDSSNFLNTTSNYTNRSKRPNARLSVDYDMDPRNSINFLLQYNQNVFDNYNETGYINLDDDQKVYRISNRSTKASGHSLNPSMNLTYTHRGKKPGETLRIIAGANFSENENNRLFFQDFLNPDNTPTGNDSTQRQENISNNRGMNFRINYDKLLNNKTTSISTGGWYNMTSNDVLLDFMLLDKTGNSFVKNPGLSNDFRFRQSVGNLRVSARQIIVEGFTVTAGINAEQTNISFDLYNLARKADNSYVSWLPFASLNRYWKEKFNLTFSYRKTIRRPGIDQLNPSIDYSNPYNTRYGNPTLEASSSHNFDLVIGKNNSKYYFNLGMGHNIVQDVFIQVRKLVEDGKTETTWQNIDDRKEFEISTWSGYTFSKKLRANFSAGYTINQYSAYDREVNRYRNGGSFTSNLNTTYSPQDVWNFSSNFTFNRFANPQGTVRSNLSMNLGIQRKLFNKRVVITVNAIDPLFQQENRSFTYGPNFNLESFNSTNTRNYRLTLGYNFMRGVSKARAKKEKEKLQGIINSPAS